MAPRSIAPKAEGFTNASGVIAEINAVSSTVDWPKASIADRGIELQIG
ncbi:MAG: hypothetical protein AAGD06_10355 [Acidobacteriota bacterium]